MRAGNIAVSNIAIILGFTFGGMVLGRISKNIQSESSSSAITNPTTQRSTLRAKVIRWDRYGSTDPWAVFIELPDGNLALAFSWDPLTPIVGAEWTVQVTSNSEKNALGATWEVSNGTWRRPGFKEPEAEKNSSPHRPM